MNFEKKRVSAEEAVQELIASIPPENKEVLKAYVEIPNAGGVMGKVLEMHKKFGGRFGNISELLAVAQEKSGMDYDELRAAVLEELENDGERETLAA